MNLGPSQVQNARHIGCGQRAAPDAVQYCAASRELLSPNTMVFARRGGILEEAVVVSFSKEKAGCFAVRFVSDGKLLPKRVEDMFVPIQGLAPQTRVAVAAPVGGWCEDHRYVYGKYKPRDSEISRDIHMAVIERRVTTGIPMRMVRLSFRLPTRAAKGS